MKTETDRSLDRILNPGSIAVVGASADKNKRGHIALKRLDDSRYDGDVYPVNHTCEGKILGREVFPSVSSIPGRVDLLYVVTPAPTVPDILEDAGEAGAAGAVIFSAGFSEVGNEDLETELKRIADSHDIRFIGPNVMGMVNVPRDLYLGIDAEYSRGDIAIVSQSGNLGMNLGMVANEARNTGISHFVSIGNEADLKFHELLPYFTSNDDTETLVVYTEGMEDGRAFLRQAHRHSRDQPIISLRGGRTRAGRSSAQSHTASLAGDADVVKQLYNQAGIIDVESFDDILPISQALSELPNLSGRNIAVMTEAGGVATIMADALLEHDLNVPELGPGTQEDLRELFTNSPNVSNPVDTMVGPETASLHAQAAEVLLSDPAIHGLLICGAYGGYGTGGHGIELPTDEESARAQVESAHRISQLPDQYDKPVIVKSTFSPRDSEALAICRDRGIPVFKEFRGPPRAFRAMAQYDEFLKSAEKRTNFVVEPENEPHDRIERIAAEGRSRLSEYEAREILTDYEFPSAPYRLVSSPGEAIEAAQEFDGDVAMKINSPDLQHKSEAGGVALNVSGPTPVRETYSELVANARNYDSEAAIDGVLVSPMVQEGVEVIIGGSYDEEVGPVVLFGLGGIFVEVLEDVMFRAVPLTEFDARQMIDNIRGRELIEGSRGEPGVNDEALVDLLLRVSRLMADNPRLQELDLNPVVCREDDLQIVDATIRLR